MPTIEKGLQCGRLFSNALPVATPELRRAIFGPRDHHFVPIRRPPVPQQLDDRSARNPDSERFVGP